MFHQLNNTLVPFLHVFLFFSDTACVGDAPAGPSDGPAFSQHRLPQYIPAHLPCVHYRQDGPRGPAQGLHEP